MIRIAHIEEKDEKVRRGASKSMVWELILMKPRRDRSRNT